MAGRHCVAEMSSEYGESPWRSDGWHFGGDIISTNSNYEYGRGAPIRSIADGTVSIVGSDQWNGNYVKVNHDDGRASYYLHLLDDVVDKNQRVAAGEVIGRMNCTGSCFSSAYGKNAIQGTHLHLEIRTSHSASRDKENHTTTINPRHYMATCQE